MADVKVTPEMIKDLDSLLNNFRMFMSLNLVHADQKLSGTAKSKVQELIRYSTDSCKKIDILKTPINNYMSYNITMVSKNLLEILNFMYKYITYAKPIVMNFLPSRLERIENIEKDYTKFMKKYF